MTLQFPRRALSIRQPWAELILIGAKTLEIRSRPTRVRGPVQIYASLKYEDGPRQRVAIQPHGLNLDDLPRGLLIGVVEIVGCRQVTPADSAQAGFEIPAEGVLFGWELAHAQRRKVPARPNRQPQPSFFFLD